MPLPTYPQRLVDYYYQHAGLAERGISLEEYHRAVQENGSVSYIEDLADHVYKDGGIEGRFDRDEFDEAIGMTKWQKERPGVLKTIGLQNVQRARDLPAGGGEFLGKIAEVFGMDEKDTDAITDWIRGKGHTPYTHTSWEDVLRSKSPADLGMMTFEVFLSSGVDMATILAAPYAYAGMFTGDIAHRRAESDERDNPSVMDMLVAAPTAAVVTLLDRWSLLNMFGLKSKLGSVRDVPLEVTKALGLEAATEGIQEGLEYAAETVGTKQGFDLNELGRSMSIGAAVGGTAGGAIRTGTAGAQLATGRHQADPSDEMNQEFVSTLNTETPKIDDEKVVQGVQQVDMNKVQEATIRLSDPQNNDPKGENKISFVMGLTGTLAKKIGVNPDLEFTKAVAKAYDAVDRKMNPNSAAATAQNILEEQEQQQREAEAQQQEEAPPTEPSEQEQTATPAEEPVRPAEEPVRPAEEPEEEVPPPPDQPPPDQPPPGVPPQATAQPPPEQEAPAQPTPAAPIPEEATTTPEEDRMRGKIVDEEANIGKRKPLNPNEVSQGDTVMVVDAQTGRPEAARVVEKRDDGMLVEGVETKNRSFIPRANGSWDQSHRVYSVRGEQDLGITPEFQEYHQEIARVAMAINEETATEDDVMVKRFKKLLDDKMFRQLPADLRTQLDEAHNVLNEKIAERERLAEEATETTPQGGEQVTGTTEEITPEAISEFEKTLSFTNENVHARMFKGFANRHGYTNEVPGVNVNDEMTFVTREGNRFKVFAGKVVSEQGDTVTIESISGERIEYKSGELESPYGLFAKPKTDKRPTVELEVKDDGTVEQVGGVSGERGSGISKKDSDAMLDQAIDDLKGKIAEEEERQGEETAKEKPGTKELTEEALREIQSEMNSSRATRVFNKDGQLLASLVKEYGYTQDVKDDVAVGDEIVFARAKYAGDMRSGMRFDSYEVLAGTAIEKQQNAFRIEFIHGGKRKIKDSFLYRVGVFAKPRDKKTSDEGRQESKNEEQTEEQTGEGVAKRSQEAEPESRALEEQEQQEEQVAEPAGAEKPAPTARVVTAQSSDRQIISDLATVFYAGAPVEEAVQQIGVQGKLTEELIEVATIKAANMVFMDGGNVLDIYKRIVEIYEAMPKLQTRTASSITLQSYSTPLPLAFAMQARTRLWDAASIYEPTAGHGALIFTGLNRVDNIVANELDQARAARMKDLLGFKNVTSKDATETDADLGRFERVIMNPPFGAVYTEGKIKKAFPMVGKYKTRSVDHKIIYEALTNHLDENGEAIFVLASVHPIEYGKSDAERAAAYKKSEAKNNFYYLLHKDFNVVDHVSIDGKLYARQGASYPIDVVYISPQGKAREYPWKSAPDKITTFDELAGRMLPSDYVVSKPTPEANAAPKKRTAEIEPATKPQEIISKSNKPKPEVVVSDGQNAYDPPKSAGEMLYPTVLPKNLAGEIHQAERDLEGEVGNLIDYVAVETGMSSANVSKVLAPEQVTAVARTIYEHKQGYGVVNGDETGMGKGRVVATVALYAMKNNIMPMFVTESAKLYRDIVRDFTAINAAEVLGRPIRALVTDATKAQMKKVSNENVEITLDDAKSEKTSKVMAQFEKDDPFGSTGYDIVFSTYNQLKSNKGNLKTRHEMFQKLGPHAFILADESHKIVGGPVRQSANDDSLPVSTLFRRILRAQGQEVRNNKGKGGVLFLSGTWAKNPQALALYFRTRMGDIIPDSLLADMDNFLKVMASGGTALQSWITRKMARSGSYFRRENSHVGIDYTFKTVDISTDNYSVLADAMDQILSFERIHVEPIITRLQGSADHARRISGSGNKIDHTNFAAKIHNIYDQFMLASKVDQAVEVAVKAIKEGRKPVITLSNTMGAFLNDQASAFQIGIGQDIDNKKLNFKRVLIKYLDDTLKYRERVLAETHIHRINISDLPEEAQNSYHKLMARLDEISMEIPVSPIDWIKYKIEKYGYSVDEITGRDMYLDYKDDKYNATLLRRDTKDKTDAGKNKLIDRFNSGNLNVLVINRSGSTGVSLHSSEEFDDKNKRVMITVQPELDPDTMMQIFGRINRRGQIEKPMYELLLANVPSEMRPAAVLLMKLMSLNANVHGDKESIVTQGGDEANIDLFGQYAATVAEDYLRSNPDINFKLLDIMSKPRNERMRVLTGRLVVLPLEQQVEIYKELEILLAAEAKIQSGMHISGTKDEVTNLNATIIDEPDVLIARESGKDIDNGVYLTPIEIDNPFKPPTPIEVVREVLATIHGEEKAQEMLSGVESEDVDALVRILKELNAFTGQLHDVSIVDRLYGEYYDMERDEMGIYDEYVSLISEHGGSIPIAEVKSFGQFMAHLIIKHNIRPPGPADRIPPVLQRAIDMKDKFVRLVEQLFPGTGIKVTSADGIVHRGIVKEIVKTTQSANPLALSSWTILIDGRMGTLRLPLSRLESLEYKITDTVLIPVQGNVAVKEVSEVDATWTRELMRGRKWNVKIKNPTYKVGDRDLIQVQSRNGNVIEQAIKVLWVNTDKSSAVAETIDKKELSTQAEHILYQFDPSRMVQRIKTGIITGNMLAGMDFVRNTLNVAHDGFVRLIKMKDGGFIHGIMFHPGSKITKRIQTSDMIFSDPREIVEYFKPEKSLAGISSRDQKVAIYGHKDMFQIRVPSLRDRTRNQYAFDDELKRLVGEATGGGDFSTDNMAGGHRQRNYLFSPKMGWEHAVPIIDRLTELGAIFKTSNRKRLTKIREDLGTNEVRKQSRFLDEVPDADVDVGALQSIAATITPLADTEFGFGRVAGEFTVRDGKHLIFVATNQRHPIKALGHEAVHSLKAAGLFTEREWRSLTRAANLGNWVEEVRAHYPELNSEELIEEAIAQNFGQWLHDTRKIKFRSSAVRKAFVKIRDFFIGLFRLLHVNGRFVNPTVESIFRNIDAGVIGSRGNRQQRRVQSALTKQSRVDKPFHQFKKPNTEKRWQAAQKALRDRGGVVGTIKEVLDRFLPKMTRHFEHMPETMESADFVEKALHLRGARYIAKTKAESFMEQVMGGDLNRKEQDILNRYFVLKNLMWSAEKSMELPYELTAEDVESEFPVIAEIVMSIPKLQERVAIRDKLLDEIRKEMIRQNVLPKHRLANKDYYHHQIREYGELRGNSFFSPGEKVKSPYWHMRRGSDKDINANYFEAEGEWLFKAYEDIETMKFLNWTKENIDLLPDLKKRAKSENDAEMLALAQAELVWEKVEEFVEGDEKDIQAARELVDDLLEMSTMDTFAKELASAISQHEYLQNYFAGRGAIAIQWQRNKRDIAMAIRGLKVRLNEIINMPQIDFFASIPEDLMADVMAFAQGKATQRNQKALSRILKWAVNQNQFEELRNQAQIVSGVLGKNDRFMQDKLGDKYVNHRKAKELVKKYGGGRLRVWQADSYDGKTRRLHIFTGKTITEHEQAAVMNKIERDGLEGVDKQTLVNVIANMRDSRILGPPMQEMVLTNEVAVTLDTFHDPMIDGWIDPLYVRTTRFLKKWYLLIMWRVLKYVTNNFSGDTDGWLQSGQFIKHVKNLPRAFRMLYGVMYKRRPIPEQLQKMINRGVIQSGLVMQDIENIYSFGIGTHALEEHFLGKMSLMELFKEYGVKSPAALLQKYFHIVSKIVRLRENAFRVAAYMTYDKLIHDELAKGHNLQEVIMKIGYAASKPWVLKGITDKDDLIARMARDVMGDYGNISVIGRHLADRHMPFYRWAESNAKRQANYGLNIWRYPRDLYKWETKQARSEAEKRKLQMLLAGKGMAMAARTGAAVTVKAGVKATTVSAKLAVLYVLFYTSIQMINNLLFEEEEEKLSPEDRVRLHLNLGTWGDDVVTFRFQGALSDYLGWFGMEEIGAVISEVEKGLATAPDIFASMAKAPINKAVNLITPIYKVPVELVTGKQFYPDFFNPGEMYDRGHHIARSFVLGEEYNLVKKHVFGLPAPGRAWVRKMLPIYSLNKGELDYNKMRGMAYSYLERIGELSGGGFKRKPISQHYYDYKKAKRLGDELSEKLAWDQIMDYAKRNRLTWNKLNRRLEQSVRAGYPKVIVGKHWLDFQSRLSEKEIQQLDDATMWYTKLMYGGDANVPRNTH